MLSKIYEALSEELIELRKNLGLSQQQLAKLVGTTKRTIRTYERNHYRSAKIETAIKIAEALENYRQQRIDSLNQ